MKISALRIFAAVVLMTVTSTGFAQSYMPASYAPWYKLNLSQHYCDSISCMTAAKTCAAAPCPDFKICVDKSVMFSKPNFDFNLDEILTEPILYPIFGAGYSEIDRAYDHSTHIISPSCVGKVKMSHIETPKWAAKQYSGSQF